MKLSVILPCYNGAKTIALQLDALTEQTYTGEWEVIVVNNGSTDNSMEIVESYRDRLPNLKIVQAYDPSGPRLGVPHSYNTGVKAATGNAVVFCEADDAVTPHWLAAMAKALSQYEFVTGPLEYTRLNEPWLLAAIDNGKWYQSEGLMDEGNTMPPYLPAAFGCNLGIRVSTYQAVGEFDLSLPISWDADYCWRVQLAGFPLHFEPDAVVHYRLRHSPKALYTQSYRWGKDRLLLLLRYSKQSLGWIVFLKELMGLVPYIAISGTKLYLMSIFNIRRGRGGFAIWCWGLGYKVGFIENLLKRDLIPSLFGKNPALPYILPSKEQESSHQHSFEKSLISSNLVEK